MHHTAPLCTIGHHAAVVIGYGIYTVSKMLGYKKLRTTQIYAKIIDRKKKEAASRIQLEL